MPRPYVAASLCACTMRLRAYATARRKTPPWHRSQYLYGRLASVSLDRRVPSKATSSYLSCKRPSISTEFRPSIYKCLTWKLGRLNLRGRTRSREESSGSSDVQAIIDLFRNECFAKSMAVRQYNDSKTIYFLYSVSRDGLAFAKLECSIAESIPESRELSLQWWMNNRYIFYILSRDHFQLKFVIVEIYLRQNTNF